MANFTAIRVEFGSGIPEIPINFTASCGFAQGTMDLSWTDVSDNENSFRIYRSTNGIDFVYVNSVAENVNTFIATSVVNFQQNWFRVSAYNTEGESGYAQTGPLDCLWITQPTIAWMPRIRRLGRRTLGRFPR